MYVENSKKKIKFRKRKKERDIRKKKEGNREIEI